MNHSSLEYSRLTSFYAQEILRCFREYVLLHASSVTRIVLLLIPFSIFLSISDKSNSTDPGTKPSVLHTQTPSLQTYQAPNKHVEQQEPQQIIIKQEPGTQLTQTLDRSKLDPEEEDSVVDSESESDSNEEEVEDEEVEEEEKPGTSSQSLGRAPHRKRRRLGQEEEERKENLEPPPPK